MVLHPSVFLKTAYMYWLHITQIVVDHADVSLSLAVTTIDTQRSQRI